MSAKVQEEKNDDAENIKDILEAVIEEVERKHEVEMFEEILQKNFRILERTREDTCYEDEHLVSEQNTAYKNLTEGKTTYRFQNCYEEGSTVAITKTNSRTACMGAGLGVGYGPVNLEVGGVAQLNREKITSDDKHKCEINHHVVEVEVPKGKTVEIKKLIFWVPKSCVSKIELTLQMEEKIHYHYKSAKTDDKEDSKKKGEIKVSKLRDKLISRLKEDRNKSYECIERGNVLIITFTRICKFSVCEHRIEARILTKTEEENMALGEIRCRIRLNSAMTKSPMIIVGKLTADGASSNDDECKTQNTDVPETT